MNKKVEPLKNQRVVIIGNGIAGNSAALEAKRLDKEAKVTHEAAIGSIDKKQMQTLMARGLSEEEAVDVIVKGVLK